MKINFGHCVGENTTPSTELPRDFCAGIGPLQLGVVLVSFIGHGNIIQQIRKNSVHQCCILYLLQDH